MQRDTDVVAYAGYGAIGALYGVLSAIGDDVVAAFEHSAATDSIPDMRGYRVALDGIVLGLSTVPRTPLWDDAGKQFLMLVERYRDAINLLSDGRIDMAAFRAAASELGEAGAIADLAIDRLGRQLRFPGIGGE